MTKEKLQSLIEKREKRCDAFIAIMGRSFENSKSLILRYDRNRIKLQTYRLMLRSFK